MHAQAATAQVLLEHNTRQEHQKKSSLNSIIVALSVSKMRRKGSQSPLYCNRSRSNPKHSSHLFSTSHVTLSTATQAANSEPHPATSTQNTAGLYQESIKGMPFVTVSRMTGNGKNTLQQHNILCLQLLRYACSCRSVAVQLKHHACHCAMQHICTQRDDCAGHSQHDPTAAAGCSQLLCFNCSSNHFTVMKMPSHICLSWKPQPLS
jgi:hypothetical protein